MPRTTVSIVHFRQAFPASEPLASYAIRALSLRRDLLVELDGLRDRQGFEGFKRHGEAAEMLYFMRSNIRTLYSLRIFVDAVSSEDRWKQWFERLEQEPKSNWIQARGILHKIQAEVERDRKSIGAHAEHTLGDVVHRLPDTFGFAEWHHSDPERGYQPRFVDLFHYLALWDGKTPLQTVEDFEAYFPAKINRYITATLAANDLLTVFLIRYGTDYRIG